MKKDVNFRIHIPFPHVLEIIRAGLRQKQINLKLSTPREILDTYRNNDKK
jgi:hypothetical protein